MATEALQASCLLLPPPNRRRLQLLLRLMARVCQNPHLPPLNDTVATRTLVQVASMHSQLVVILLCTATASKHYNANIMVLKLLALL